MEENYEVLFGQNAAGKVQVLHQGLYYLFHCRCRLSGDTVCRLFVRCGDREESLGVVVPMGDGFGLDTRLAVKRLGEGEMQFRLVPKHDRQREGTFVPIAPEEPFAYLARLKDAYFARQGETPGVVLPSSGNGDS